ncbi:CvpA family protein [uncultured Sanguibacteroides sp.]|uniref:CvpA family protein n=1 Tax=uncultured Sanguibacteroides sp. TaxID=1635151 RepID=UPI0025EF4B0C|nr:CvpA family protein [uncultured Sanguibacteroides sp.]
MNYVDVIILLPLVYGAYKGFTSGLIVEMSTLFALILGVFISLKYGGVTEAFLKDFIDIPVSYSYYVAFAVTFLLVVIVIHLLGKLLTKLVDMVSLGLFNKLFGILLGTVKAAIVVCVILFVINALDSKYDFIPAKTKNQSMLYYPFVNFANGVYQSAVN